MKYLSIEGKMMNKKQQKNYTDFVYRKRSEKQNFKNRNSKRPKF